MQRASALLFAVVFASLCPLLVVDTALTLDKQSAAEKQSVVDGQHGDAAEDRDRTQLCLIVFNIAENDQYASANGLSDPSRAEIAQELGISVNVVQNCLQQAGAGAPPSGPPNPDPPNPGPGTGGGNGNNGGGANDLECASFASQNAAQDALEQNLSDPNNLDPDGNGTACEDYNYGKVLNAPNKPLPETGGPPLLALAALGLASAAVGVSVLRAGLRREE